MNKASEIFLTIFKDIKITRSPANPGTDEAPNYVCLDLNTKLYIPHKRMVQMIKEYQDAVIESLLS